MWIFESLVLNLPHRERIQNDRQQTLNCALSVDFLWKKKFDRTRVNESRSRFVTRLNESQIGPAPRGIFKLCLVNMLMFTSSKF